jgi:hypothetical protein
MDARSPFYVSLLGLFTLLPLHAIGCFANAGLELDSEDPGDDIAAGDEADSLGEDAAALATCATLGSKCCAGGVCSIGVCNVNNVCRNSCGNLGEKCCFGGMCSSGSCSAGTCVNPSPGDGGPVPPGGTCASSIQCYTGSTCVSFDGGPGTCCDPVLRNCDGTGILLP